MTSDELLKARRRAASQWRDSADASVSIRANDKDGDMKKATGIPVELRGFEYDPDGITRISVTAMEPVTSAFEPDMRALLEAGRLAADLREYEPDKLAPEQAQQVLAEFVDRAQDVGEGASLDNALYTMDNMDEYYSTEDAGGDA